jgi:tRNA G10  N-methylase Trm11
VEYWVIGRRDLDSLLFGVRLTAGPKKTANRGSLSSDLSTLLVKASEPRSDDVFLDPFGGSGSIVVARLESPFRKAIWSDIRLPELRSELPARLVNSRKVHVLGEDALRLPSVPDGSISSIITDPPWGEYEDLGRPYGDFIAGVMASFDRVLDPVYGRLVILLSRRASSAVAEVWRQANFRIEHSHDILVNGHPATVLVGGR